MLNSLNKVGIPYDPIHPFEYTLNPGETVTLYGNITFTNNTNESVHIKLHFDLRKGFEAFIDGKEPVSVSMHSKYLVDASQDTAATLLLSALEKMNLGG